jgi:hypothetical protein
VVLATQATVAGAQIPDPLETIDSVVQEGVDTVTDTVTQTTNTVTDTVDQTANTVENVATQPVPKATGTDPVNTLDEASGGAATETTNTLSGSTGSGSQQKEAAAGASPAGTSGGPAAQRAYTAAMAGTMFNWVRARGLFNSAALLAGAQPSLAILVDAVNDADGDGIFSDEEVAPVPGSDVTFKALITNIGSMGFEIAAVNHTYTGVTGPSQDKVCAELTGIMLAPGESLACSFPVGDYAPARGERLVNTVMAAAFEVGKGARRGASDSDTSTVETLVPGDDVMAVVVRRNLAFTGTEAARLLALGLVLLAAGGGCLSLARRRSRRPISPAPWVSSVEFLAWWSDVSRRKEKAHSK